MKKLKRPSKPSAETSASRKRTPPDTALPSRGRTAKGGAGSRAGAPAKGRKAAKTRGEPFGEDYEGLNKVFAPNEEPTPSPKAKKGRKAKKAPNPGLAERNETIRREKPRLKGHAPRRGSGRVYGFVCVLVIIGMIIYGSTVFFKLKHVAVEGSTHYAASEITRLSGFRIDDNLLFLKRRTAEKNIEESLPYVKSVSTHMALPDTITITVEERIPYAAVQSGAAYVIFDKEGRILERNVSADVSNIPVILGVALTDEKPGGELFHQDPERMGPVVAVLKALDDCGMIKDVQTLDAGESFNIRFTYLGRLTVEMGLTEDVADKLRMLSGIVPMLGEHERGILDLSSGRARYVADQSGGVLKP
jgi:cell division protein FtsQ